MTSWRIAYVAMIVSFQTLKTVPPLNISHLYCGSSHSDRAEPWSPWKAKATAPGYFRSPALETLRARLAPVLGSTSRYSDIQTGALLQGLEAAAGRALHEASGAAAVGSRVRFGAGGTKVLSESMVTDSMLMSSLSRWEAVVGRCALCCGEGLRCGMGNDAPRRGLPPQRPRWDKT